VLTPPSAWSSPAAFTATLIVEAIMTLIGIAWIGRDVVRGRRPLAFPLLLIGSAALAVFPDAAGTTVANLQYFPSEGSPILYTAFGRPEGPFVILGWTAWGSILGYTAVLVVERRWSLARMGALYGGIVAADIVLEVVFVHFLKVYTYFGSQPAEILDVPFSWPFATVATGMAIGLVMWYLYQRWDGYRRLLLLPVAPGVFMAFMAATTWPTSLALGLELSTPAASALGLLSVALVIGALAGLVGLVRNPQPAIPANDGS
jgi:hypothetical protein